MLNSFGVQLQVNRYILSLFLSFYKFFLSLSFSLSLFLSFSLSLFLSYHSFSILLASSFSPKKRFVGPLCTPLYTLLLYLTSTTNYLLCMNQIRTSETIAARTSQTREAAVLALLTNNINQGIYDIWCLCVKYTGF